MPTIVITVQLALALQNLKAGYRINKVKRRRMNPYYLWVHSAGYNSELHSHDVSEAIVKQLEAMKLIDGSELNPRELYFRGAKRVYRINEAGKNFRLPPEEFWVRE